ncbi:hypothetical protein [Bosea sp. TAF32]|uniref:hypothetical protein n=1 Tax=Bosea sp. TAF32 TaxID=3237482 RepID=UPI003F9197E4
MEDQPVEIAGDIGEGQFRLGPRQTDGAMNRPNRFFWWTKTRSTAGRIVDLLALARATCCGIGRPGCLRRWIRQTSIFVESPFSFFRER